MTRLYDLIAAKLCRALLGPDAAAFFLDDPWQATLFAPEVPAEGTLAAVDLAELVPGRGEFLRC